MRLIDADELLRRYDEEHEGPPGRARKLIEEAQTIGGWINVKDRMPEEKENPYTQDYQEVLCVLKTRFGTDVRVYKFGKGHFWNGPREIDRVISHWMPFPELPKEESND